MRYLTLLFLTVSFSALADDDYRALFHISVQINDDDGKGLKDTKLEIYKENELYRSYTSDEKGKAKLEGLPTWGSYIIKIKQEGYVTKIATINADDYYYDEDMPGLNWRFQVRLFKTNPELDFSYLEKEPVIHFYFNQLGYQDWDKYLLERMKLKIQLTFNKMDTLHLDSVSGLIDQAMMWEKYHSIDSAIAYLDQAHQIYPIEFLKTKLNDTKDRKKVLEEKFNVKVNLADSLYQTGKNYVKAYDNYVLANEIIRETPHVKKRILEIEKMIFGEEEPHINSKMDFSYNSAYRRGLKEAYQFYEDGDYESAIALYLEAQKIFPDIPYPTNQITTIKKLKEK